MDNKIHVSVIGASGYSGMELVRILLRHPHVVIDTLFANTSAGKRFDEVVPAFRNQVPLTLESFSVDKLETSDLVFIALPSGEALNLVPKILETGKRVIDLGGDFRLKDTSLYEKYYKRDHTALAALQQATFGLPEWFADEIRNTQFVSNPGCYPTSVILPLAPLLKEKILDPGTIIANSLSGVSGAGRSASPELSFCEVNDSVKAYKVGVHQHIPEIRTILERIGGVPTPVTFVPHLLPITRGIFTTIYASLEKSIHAEDILAAYGKYYSKAPFVRVSATVLPELKHVLHTNFIDIGFTYIEESNQLILHSVIDNLVKGAAGQAVQNMNLMFNFSQTEGLL